MEVPLNSQGEYIQVKWTICTEILPRSSFVVLVLGLSLTQDLVVSSVVVQALTIWQNRPALLSKHVNSFNLDIPSEPVVASVSGVSGIVSYLNVKSNYQQMFL